VAVVLSVARRPTALVLAFVQSVGISVDNDHIAITRVTHLDSLLFLLNRAADTDNHDAIRYVDYGALTIPVGNAFNPIQLQTNELQRPGEFRARVHNREQHQ